MSKPTKYLIELRMESLTQESSSKQPYGSRATLTHMRRCEAREWLERYRDKAKTDGAAQANFWWRKTIMDIERIRGLDAATELRHLMNLERKK